MAFRKTFPFFLFTLFSLLIGAVPVVAKGFAPDTTQHLAHFVEPLGAVSDTTACNCVAVFEAYAARLEATHIGYYMEVLTKEQGLYERHKAQYLRKSRRTSLEACVHLVNAWIDFFDDPHVGAMRRFPDSIRTTRGWPTSLGERSSDETLRSLRARKDKLDPIEGVWYTGHQEIGIVEEAESPGLFVAVVLKDDSSLGVAGNVIARFERGIEQGIYDMRGVRDYADAREASIHRGVLLYLGLRSWGRRYPERVGPDNPLHPTDPLHPMLSILDPQTVLITLPSHQYPYYARLDSLVEANRSALQTAQALIVDVRGNYGGSGLTGRPLAPYYFSRDQWEQPARYAPGWVLVSEDNRAVYESQLQQAGGEQAHPWLRETVASLQAAAPGTLIRDAFHLIEPFRPDTVYASIRHVGIITDWINISAVDAFLQEAKASTKVIQFGEATDSAIDYQSTVTFRIAEPAACAEEGFLFYYPRSASSWMPYNPINPTGFEPDVPLEGPPDAWVGKVQAYLRTVPDADPD